MSFEFHINKDFCLQFCDLSVAEFLILLLCFSSQAVEYEGWSDVFFLSQFILSCIMG